MRTLYEWLSLMIQLGSVVIVIVVLILTLNGAKKISQIESDFEKLSAKVTYLEEKIDSCSNDAFDARQAEDKLSNFQYHQERFRNEIVLEVKEYRENLQAYKNLILEITKKE